MRKSLPGEIRELPNSTSAAGLFVALGSTWQEYNLAADNAPRFFNPDRDIVIALEEREAERVREFIRASEKRIRQENRALRSTPPDDFGPHPEPYEPNPYDGTYSEE